MGSLSDLRVLVVEDDPMLAMDLEELLRQAGCQTVGPCATVKSALRIVREEKRLNAAVVDINLNGEMAFPVADALVAADVAFVWVTGYSRDILPTRYQGWPLITKPLLRDMLISELTTIAGSDR